MRIWDKNKVYKEALNLIQNYGELPGRPKLKEIGRIDFIMALRRHYPGQMTQLRKDLNLKSKCKPANYWTKQKVIDETKKIISSEGKMPSQKHLRELGHSTINTKAREYYGGLRGLAIACGISKEKLSTEFRYWQNIENVKNEIFLLNEQLGRFPTTYDFRLLGKHSLLGAISKYYGGIKKLRIILDCKEKHPISKDGHNCDSYSEVIIDDFLYSNNIEHRRDVQFNFGNIKCRPDFVLNNGYIIEVLMADYRENGHIGKYKYYVERYLKKKDAYLRNNIKVIEIFPIELIDKIKFDKKLSKVARLANVPLPYHLDNFSNISFFNKKSPGFWKNPKNLKKELLPLIKKFGHIPTINELREIGRNDIEGAIINIYGSYWNVAKAIGFKTDSLIKPQKYWQNIENLKKELMPIIKEYSYLPSRAIMMERGMRNIIAAIEVYYNSFDDFAKLLKVEYKPEKRTNGYWLNPQNIRLELESIIKTLGRFPSAKDIYNLKLSGLIKGILSVYGSLRNAAIQLELEIPNNKPKGYWKNLSNVLYELELLVLTLKRFPSYSEIEKNKSMLSYAIKHYHGGIVMVRKAYFINHNNQ